MKFSIKDLFSKCDQIRKILRIWSHLLKKSLMEKFIFCAVIDPKLWSISEWLVEQFFKTGRGVFVEFVLFFLFYFKIFRIH